MIYLTTLLSREFTHRIEQLSVPNPEELPDTFITTDTEINFYKPDKKSVFFDHYPTAAKMQVSRTPRAKFDKMQVSRTPRAKFDWRAALPGVGEALSGKSLGCFWWVRRGYGDLKIAAVLDLAGKDARGRLVCSNPTCILQIF